MLNNFRHLVKLTSQIIKKCEFQSRLPNEKIVSVLRCASFLYNQKQNFHTSTPCFGSSMKLLEYRKAQKAAVHKIEVQGSFHDSLLKMREQGYFPTADLPNKLFDGVPFKDIPTVNIKVTRNNTILSLSDQGRVKLNRSCGMDGFKNARKGTNIAAQTSGTALGLRAVKRGYKNVRVVIKGLGPGRLSVLKGLQLSGMNIISITDSTKDQTRLRPRKQRRL